MSMKPEDMKDEVLQELLEKHPMPKADGAKKAGHMAAAMKAFEIEAEKNVKKDQGLVKSGRPMGVQTLTQWIGDFTMKKAYVAGGAVALGVFAVALTNTTMLSSVMPEFGDNLQDTFSEISGGLESGTAGNIATQDKPAGKQDKNAKAQMMLDESLIEAEEDIAVPSAEPTVMPKPAKELHRGNIAPAQAPLADISKSKAERKKYSVEGFAGGAPQTLSMIAPAPGDGYVQQQPQYVGRDQFEKIEESPIKLVTEEPVSTFSIDVDTASYSFVRRQLNNGVLPQPNAVRVEEMVNYFDYDYPLPASKDEPFKPTVAVYQTPWNKETQLVHIGIKGHDVIKDEKPRSNLVFLIDTSGSMSSQDKLPLLKNAFKMMVENLDEEDTVSIAVYAGSAGTVLEPTKVKDKQKILSALDRLQSGGSTAGAAGIKLAYDLAQENFDKDAVNRVFLATDGDFNVGITDREELKGYIERKRDSGVFLSVIGFGQGNYNDALMQKLAQNGNGVAAYIDSLNEARKVLVEEASSTIYPIAKDVKIQVEFNPAQVAEYRLIGYQTRKLNREDFNNDKVDAGDIGAGHTVTAIYEITPTDSTARKVDPLRYGQQEAADKSLVSNNDEIAHLKLRYKLPKETKSKLITYPITSKDEKGDVNETTEDMRFAASVAAFGEKLRGGKYLGEFGYDAIIDLANSAKGKDEFGYRAEFVNLVRLAKNMPAMQ